MRNFVGDVRQVHRLLAELGRVLLHSLEPGQKWAGELKLLERAKITEEERQAAREVGPAIGLPSDEYLASQGLTREDIARMEAEEEAEDADELEEVRISRCRYVYVCLPAPSAAGKNL